MLVRQAKALATEWVLAYAREQNVRGAVYNGSVVERSETDQLPEASDIDINLIVQGGGDLPPKPGKLWYQGVLLDVGFVPLDAIFPKEKLLATYELAGCFCRDGIILDSTGYLREAADFVRAHFARPQWVDARCSGVYRKIEAGMRCYHADAPLLDNVNSWLFPTGICTHAVLVAALQNPTVRLRYLRARPILEDWGCPELYEHMLELLGCAGLSARRVQAHLDRLDRTFRAAARCSATTFPFSGDINRRTRHIAIDGSRRLIAQGDHREAVFWIAVTFERCHKILRADDPELHARYLPDLLELLSDLGVETNKKIGDRIALLGAFLPALRAVVGAHLPRGQTEWERR